jgi:hypothetical protein
MDIPLRLLQFATPRTLLSAFFYLQKDLGSGTDAHILGVTVHFVTEALIYKHTYDVQRVLFVEKDCLFPVNIHATNFLTSLLSSQPSSGSQMKTQRIYIYIHIYIEVVVMCVLLRDAESLRGL